MHKLASVCAYLFNVVATTKEPLGVLVSIYRIVAINSSASVSKEPLALGITLEEQRQLTSNRGNTVGVAEISIAASGHLLCRNGSTILRTIGAAVQTCGKTAVKMA